MFFDAKCLVTKTPVTYSENVKINVSLSERRHLTEISFAICSKSEIKDVKPQSYCFADEDR